MIKLNNEDIAVKFAEHQKEIGSLKYRMSDCEKEQQTINDLALSVKSLAVNMEHMLKEQLQQGKRLLKLEQAPLEDYKHYKRLIVGCMITGIIGAVIGAVLTLIIR